MASIFLNFDIPNATTWFYLSLILAVALFFKFSRLLSIRNLDVLALFLLVPGLLLRQEALAADLPSAEGNGAGANQLQGPPAEGQAALPNHRLLWLAYLLMLLGSGALLARCLADLALERRPALAPNLNFAGLAWLAAAFMVCLVAVACRSGPTERVGKEVLTLEEGQRRLDDLAGTATGQSSSDVRFWVDRSRAILCHLAVVSALIWIGWRHFQDAAAGMAAATFYLLLPYTVQHVSQWQLVWPAALMLWAIAAYKKPLLAGVLLGLAAGTAYFPFLIVPVWISFYWGQGGREFLAAFLATAALCLLGTVVLLSGQLASVIDTTLTLADWQPWRDTTAEQIEGIWTGVHWAYRIPIFIAYAAFAITTFFWPRPKNLAHLIALSAALVIGIQFWFAYQGGIYVLWYLPLLLLLVFRPNLSDRGPVPLPPEGDALTRLYHWLTQHARKWLGIPEPPVPVS